MRVRSLTRHGQTEKGSEAGPEVYTLILENPGWPEWTPGQFAMVRSPEWKDLTWGRPLSICDVTDEALILFFQVYGRGTERLGRVREGETLTVWGPLGKGFAVEPERKTLILAGGVGLPPFVGYARRHPAPENVSLFFGRRTGLEYYPIYEDAARAVAAESFLEQSRADLNIFISMIRERMENHADGLTLACGPTPFLRTIQKFSLELQSKCQLSLENKMGCGVGACLGCVVKASGGWPVPVCQLGPVFWADKVDLD